MKRNLFAMLMIFALAQAATDQARGSFDEGGHVGGGSKIAGDFVRYARYLVEALSLETRVPGFSAQEGNLISTVIPKVEVFAVESSELCTNYIEGTTGKSIERCEDAHYESSTSSIKINLETWPKLGCLQKMNLVAHEYGRASGLENASYAFSSSVFVSTESKNQCVTISDYEAVYGKDQN